MNDVGPIELDFPEYYWQALQELGYVQVNSKILLKLSARFGEDAARFAATQQTLRKKGIAKFSRAANMVFEAEALEQATHERVAQYRALKFPEGVKIDDLTCGIGGDLMAIANNRDASGFDVDAGRLKCAHHNLKVYDLRANLRNEDAMESEWNFAYAIADPSRRVTGKRVWNPSDFQPNPILLASRMSDLLLGAIKLSPLLSDQFLQSLSPNLEFISLGRECREVVAWIGKESKPGIWATHVESGESLMRSTVLCQITDPPKRFIYEADPAVIRAHGLSHFKMDQLGEIPGYLTSNRPETSPWLAGFEVVSGPIKNEVELKKELQRFGSSSPVIKARSNQVSVLNLSSKLKLQGKKDCVVIAYDVGKSLRFLIAQRILG